MVRNYQQKPGSGNYRYYKEETLVKCLAMIKSNKTSLPKASKEFEFQKEPFPINRTMLNKKVKQVVKCTYR